METVLDPVVTGLLIAAVVGATEAVKRAWRRELEVTVIIVVAALLGGLGAVLMAELTAIVFFSGVAIGLGASGVVTTAEKLGSRD